VVVVPTRQAERSFLERGLPQERLLWNPPGADLEVFQPTARPPLDAPTILCVGRWSVRKGCEVLGRAVARQPWRVVHVGAGGDAPPPPIDRFERLDPRPLSEMRQVYRAAHIFVDPSLDDEIATAPLHAAASGLPLVCSDRSRGEDLRAASADPTAVTVVPALHPATWRDAIASALAQAERQTGLRAWLPRATEQFSWKAYALRYEQEMRRFLESPPDDGTRQSS
jgi:glycosyltransferase involved in cell wall biosynthesis